MGEIYNVVVLKDTMLLLYGAVSNRKTWKKSLKDNKDYELAPSPFAEFRFRIVVTASKSIFKNYSIQAASTTTRVGCDVTDTGATAWGEE